MESQGISARSSTSTPCLPPSLGALLMCFDLDEALSMLPPDAHPIPAAAVPLTPSAARDAVQAMLPPSQPGVCAVCMEEYGGDGSVTEVDQLARCTPCNRSFHTTCIASWLVLHNSCPMCRCKIPSVAGDLL